MSIKCMKVSDVELMAEVLRQFKVDPVLKTDPNLYNSSLNLYKWTVLCNSLELLGAE